MVWYPCDPLRMRMVDGNAMGAFLVQFRTFGDHADAMVGADSDSRGVNSRKSSVRLWGFRMALRSIV